MMSELINKIVNWADARSIVKVWQETGLKVVFTNGCFDIIHPGHVLYLENAAQQGHRLVVGLNSDASVSRLKGEDRPIQNDMARATVLAGLESVDLVVVFEEDTPLDLIKEIQPDVLVKGGDWVIEDIVGSDIVLEKGGEVRSLLFEDGHSTTNIIDKILKNEG